MFSVVIQLSEYLAIRVVSGPNLSGYLEFYCIFERHFEKLASSQTQLFEQILLSQTDTQR